MKAKRVYKIKFTQSFEIVGCFDYTVNVVVRGGTKEAMDYLIRKRMALVMPKSGDSKVEYETLAVKIESIEHVCDITV